MESILSIIYVVFAVVLLFSAAIFVHEYGHYWSALKCGLRVDEFAIGFGPRLFSWKHNGVLWSFRAIPAGGFVKLPQMVTAEAIEGKTEGEEPIPPASPMARIIVAFAGPLMNIVFAFLIAIFLYFVGLPVLVNPSVIGKLDPESAEYQMGIREGDEIVAINGKPVKSWQEVNQETIFATTNVLDVAIAQNGETNTYQLKAESRGEGIGLKWLNLVPRETPVVGAVQSGWPAEDAGLESGDKFISFNGVPVYSQERLVELVHDSEGEPSEVVVNRDGEEMSFTVTPRYDPNTESGRIGIIFSAGIYRVQKPGPPPFEQITNVLDQMKRTILALIYSKQTGVSAKDLSGPVGIMGGLAVQVSIDYRLALNFMVLLNVNLAILNLLPIPVLDGGHILMAIYEAIFKNPVSLKVQEWATSIFALLLISFMLYVTFFDIKRVPIFKSMFEMDTQVEQGEPADAESEPAPATQ